MKNKIGLSTRGGARGREGNTKNEKKRDNDNKSSVGCYPPTVAISHRLAVHGLLKILVPSRREPASSKQQAATGKPPPLRNESNNEWMNECMHAFMYPGMLLIASSFVLQQQQQINNPKPYLSPWLAIHSGYRLSRLLWKAVTWRRFCYWRGLKHNEAAVPTIQKL